MAITVRSGETIEVSGLYACTECDFEVTCVKGEPAPPCAICDNSEFVLKEKAKHLRG